MTLTTDEVTRARIQAYVLQFARERNISTAEATIRMLTGHRSVLDPTPPPVVHVFTPKGPLPGDLVYMPTSGWTGPEGTAAFDDWLAQCDPKVVDLDAAEHHELAGYVPNDAMKAFVRARDGKCIFPGCNVPATRCQLDHRIPYAEGGPTTPANLHCLCQKHHNVKSNCAYAGFKHAVRGGAAERYSLRAVA
ncbi:HNH endonuclease signature motif containing protein [Corynebacterium sp. Marseille-P4321]|uniref:HNH endonuclease signature motif containing protein n=1 Tax=Corynebacterium sp. Marseille-P4321 TaxID=2736603 RepID=UPI0020CA3C80|nr:HNH endonuclease signature motif containing protein [Corynebacterium sp. Marseille-P4321]